MGRLHEQHGGLLITRRFILGLAPVLTKSVVTTRSLVARSYAVLIYSAGAADGGVPVAGLIKDAAGTLQGTTQFGGASPCSGSVD